MTEDAMGAHPRALSPPCSQKECHPPSGASISPGLRLAPHCSKEADAAAYAAYKRQSIDKASGELPHGAQVIELPHRACLSGSIRAGMAGVSTPFVAVLQNDMPVKRKFDLFALLALMETEPRVEKVHFSVDQPVPRQELQGGVQGTSKDGTREQRLVRAGEGRRRPNEADARAAVV